MKQLLQNKQLNMANLIAFCKNICIDFIGGVLLTIGIYNFASEALFPMTGVSGISLLLYNIFNTPIGTMIMILNVPIIIACYRILGASFMLKSIRTIIVTSLVMDFVGPLIPLYSGERILAAICTGIFAGLGFAVIFMNNSSTGGVDFITMSIRAKNPHFSIGKIAFCIDLVVILMGGYVYREMDGIIYGLLVSLIQATVIDKIMYGIDSGKMALIVTESGEEMANMINSHGNRGATLLHGIGSYSRTDKDIVMCACNNKEMFLIKNLTKKVDPNCFTVIMESNEVVGLGFKPN